RSDACKRTSTPQEGAAAYPWARAPTGDPEVLRPRRGLVCGVFLLQVGPASGRLRAVRGRTMPMTAEARTPCAGGAAHCRIEVADRQATQLVGGLPLESRVRDEAIQTPGHSKIACQF